MGVENTQRSFNDRLYVSMTNKDEVVGLTLNYVNSNDVQSQIKVKVSYALPLEVVFLTPLAEWNPYSIPHKDNCDEVKGSGTLTSPYDSTCPDLFFRTPQKLFTNATQCGGVLYEEEAYYFLAPNGDKVCLIASGIRTVIPAIHGQHLGIRQRFPIAPVYKDGAAAGKKLDAMEDSIGFSIKNLVSKISLQTGVSTKVGVNEHSHYIRLSIDQYKALQHGMYKMFSD